MSEQTANDDPAIRSKIRTFTQILINTMVANVTTSFVWFGLTFWIYLQTRSVLATGIIGGGYMLFVAVFAIVFGSLVDRFKKRRVMLISACVTVATFTAAGIIYLFFPTNVLLNISGPVFWAFTALILMGGVVEQLRAIALSTTVTMLIPQDKHANANGLVGTASGISLIITSVFSGLAIGFLGMGWTLLIGIGVMGLTLGHLLVLKIPGDRAADPTTVSSVSAGIDLRGTIAVIAKVPGLFPMIFFATFNNLIGGVTLALLDPYALTMFSVQMWGVVFAVASTGFIIGGLVIGKVGLGKNPIRTLLVVVFVMSLVGALFTVREWAWLFVAGVWLYMALVPAIEAAEQTIIQKLISFDRQGRVFGFAQAFEAGAAPITAFLIAPIAEFLIIPYMNSAAGQASFGWLVGSGDSRGIALIFFISGIVMAIVSLAVFRTRAYRSLSAQYAEPTADPVQVT